MRPRPPPSLQSARPEPTTVPTFLLRLSSPRLLSLHSILRFRIFPSLVSGNVPGDDVTSAGYFSTATHTIVKKTSKIGGEGICLPRIVHNWTILDNFIFCCIIQARVPSVRLPNYNCAIVVCQSLIVPSGIALSVSATFVFSQCVVCIYSSQFSD